MHPLVHPLVRGMAAGLRVQAIRPMRAWAAAEEEEEEEEEAEAAQGLLLPSGAQCRVATREGTREGSLL